MGGLFRILNIVKMEKLMKKQLRIVLSLAVAAMMAGPALAKSRHGNGSWQKDNPKTFVTLPQGLLFPAGLVISGKSIYVTNLALPLTSAKGDEFEEDVILYTVSKLALK